MNTDTADTFSFCAPSTLVNDFTILPIQPNLLSHLPRHTGSCGSEKDNRPFPLQLDRMEKDHLSGLGNYMCTVVILKIYLKILGSLGLGKVSLGDRHLSRPTWRGSHTGPPAWSGLSDYCSSSSAKTLLQFLETPKPEASS